jgi:hypothetical protein
MPGDHPHQSPIAPLLTCLPALSSFLLRPQLLMRLYAFPRGGLSRRLPASIGRSCSTLKDVRLRAGTLISQLSRKVDPDE